MMFLIGLDPLNPNIQPSRRSEVGGQNYSQNKLHSSKVAADSLLILTYLPCPNLGQFSAKLNPAAMKN